MESPGYSSGYYFSKGCKPNESEWRIFRRYQNLDVYPPTVQGAAQDIREEEEGVANGRVILYLGSMYWPYFVSEMPNTEFTYFKKY